MVDEKLKGSVLYTNLLYSNDVLNIESITKISLNTSQLFINNVPFYQVIRHLRYNEPVCNHSNDIDDILQTQTWRHHQFRGKTLLFSQIKPKSRKILTICAKNKIKFESDNICINDYPISDYIQNVIELKSVVDKCKDKLYILECEKKIPLSEIRELETQEEYIVECHKLSINTEKELGKIGTKLTRNNIMKSKDLVVEETIIETICDIIEDVVTSIKKDKRNVKNTCEELNFRITELENEIEINKVNPIDISHLITCEYSSNSEMVMYDNNTLGSYSTEYVVTDNIMCNDKISGLDFRCVDAINLCVTSIENLNEVVDKIVFGNTPFI